ncbi:MAG: pyridoxamine 5'-phosphate oxidase family protein [Acidobacteria bacterium]|nr:pyridoxamine 5'-phosphate oxidase family protein [Acidobacteriota bacterium]
MFDQMGERESIALLRKGRVGRLGCCSEGKPYVVPINYLFDGKFVYMHSLSGYKIDALRANPQACLQTDIVEDDYHWRSVLAFGICEEVTNETLRKRVLDEFLKRLPHQTPVETHLSDPAKVIVFRLRVSEITGVYENW